MNSLNTRNILLSLVLTILLAVPTYAQDELRFRADIHTISPQSYPTQAGLTEFYLAIDGDTADIYLPYIGQVYMPTFGNDGLNFKAKCTDTIIIPGKKKDRREISFTVRNDIVTYRFSITMYANNTIYVHVQPSNAQGCSYIGTIRTP